MDCMFVDIFHEDSFSLHGLQTFGFSLILIGVNYLILRERELAYRAATVENYVNQAVEQFA